MGGCSLAFLRPANSSEAAAMLVIGLFWLWLFHVTGDRRLFFPYSMQFAAYVGCVNRRDAAKLAAVFLAIRVWQGAPAGVLGVEAVVSLAVTSFVVTAHGPRLRGVAVRVLGGAIGSGLAYAGLAF